MQVENSFPLTIRPNIVHHRHWKNAFASQAFTMQPNFHSFLIYRSARGEQLRPYKTVYIPDAELTQQKLDEIALQFNPPDGVTLPTVAPDTYYFTEFTLKENTVYKYRVEAQYIDGAVSPMSQPVLVIY